MKTLFFIATFTIASMFAMAQENVYFVSFIDKKETPHDLSEPQSFLSQRAIERRARFDIMVDHTDLPNNPSYIDKLREQGAERVLSIKWLQGALIYASEEDYINIKDLSFVDTAIFLNALPSKESKNLTRKIMRAEHNHVKEALPQIEQINLKALHDKGFKGKGIHISVIDAGYLMADGMECFDAMRAENRLLSTRDFVNPYSDIYSEHVHGALVLGIMAALVKDSTLGTAPEASYHLLRSENYDSETPSEMYYWSAAAEYADSVGSDIITTSLGYTVFDDSTKNLMYSDLDGLTTPCSKSAKMAVEKGIVVLASAGNDGNKKWRKISVPSDAENVISVGAVDKERQYAYFSSQGYSTDGRIKPDIATLGQQSLLVRTDGTLGYANGTSFACPIAAGMIACIMQAAPNATPMQIIAALRATASQHATPDSLLGYGIPDAVQMLNYLINNSNTVNSVIENKWQLRDNPVNDSFSIINIRDEVEYKIFDVMAFLHQTGVVRSNEEVSTSELQNGLYILVISNNQYSQSIKMMVN